MQVLVSVLKLRTKNCASRVETKTKTETSSVVSSCSRDHNNELELILRSRPRLLARDSRPRASPLEIRLKIVSSPETVHGIEITGLAKTARSVINMASNKHVSNTRQRYSLQILLIVVRNRINKANE